MSGNMVAWWSVRPGCRRRRRLGGRRFSLRVVILWLLSVFVLASSATSGPFWKDWSVWLLRAGSETTASNDYTGESSNGISQTVPVDNETSLLKPPTTNRYSSEDDDGESQSLPEGEDDRANALTNKRQRFLDRIAVISSSLMRREDDESTLQYNSGQQDDDDDSTDLDAITPQSDLSRPGRRIHVVTTAALPWFTGTAVNPLLRAAYLHRYTQEINRPLQQPPQRWVTFVIPWLEWPEDQQTLYGRVFANCSEQEEYIRSWLRDDAEMADAACPTTGLEIVFYPARYHAGLGSIFAMGDIMEMVSSSSSSSFENSNGSNNSTTDEWDTTNSTSDLSRQLDVCFLEEPEHCNWYRAPGDGWTKRFNFVVGIVHTSTCGC
jgi:hypothetical protein